jgi:ABC-type dipeptide/oligopeptide/nickel transport system ATPase subunit
MDIEILTRKLIKNKSIMNRILNKKKMKKKIRMMTFLLIKLKLKMIKKISDRFYI